MSDAQKSAAPHPLRAIIACTLTAGLGYGLGYPLNLGHLFGISEAIQIVVGIPSVIRQTERYYDLTGSTTFILLTLLSLSTSLSAPLFTAPISFLNQVIKTITDGPSANPLHFRRVLISGCIIAWAIRLGSHLFTRIIKDKEDKRFALVKSRPLSFLSYWVVQGLWVFIVSLPTHLLNLSVKSYVPWNVIDYVGLGLFTLGWGIEIIADQQKKKFRADKKNKDRFITNGLWRISRHPNYFGEITLWSGIVIMTASTLQGPQWLALVSPAFTWLLLNYVSGIPLLEASADAKWGGETAYQEYKRRTPILTPLIGKRG